MAIPLLVVLVLVAVAAGLVVGSFSARALEPDQRERKRPKTAGDRARRTVASAAVRVWRWSRARKRDENRER